MNVVILAKCYIELLMCAVTSIAQRHANPELQPATTDELYPRHKQLLIRRSVRCKVSESLLCFYNLRHIVAMSIGLADTCTQTNRETQNTHVCTDTVSSYCLVLISFIDCVVSVTECNAVLKSGIMMDFVLLDT